jgi:hypothetical protein
LSNKGAWSIDEGIAHMGDTLLNHIDLRGDCERFGPDLWGVSDQNAAMLSLLKRFLAILGTFPETILVYFRGAACVSVVPPVFPWCRLYFLGAICISVVPHLVLRRKDIASMKKWVLAGFVLSVVAFASLNTLAQPPGGGYTPPNGMGGTTAGGGTTTGSDSSESNGDSFLPGVTGKSLLRPIIVQGVLVNSYYKATAIAKGKFMVHGDPNEYPYYEDSSTKLYTRIPANNNNPVTTPTNLASAGGDITIRFDWQRGADNANPPPKVIVKRWSHANAGAIPNVSLSSPAGTATSNNGLGDPEVRVNTLTPSYPGFAFKGVTTFSKGFHESIQTGGESFTVTGSPSLSRSNTSTGGALIDYRVDILPPYVSGTNCSFDWKKPAGSSQGTLVDYKVTLGDNTPPILAGTTPTNWKTKVRYMSNHFTDDTPINIKVEYTVTIPTADANGGNSSKPITFTENQVRVAYNKHSYLNSSELGNESFYTVNKTLVEMKHKILDGTGDGNTTYSKDRFTDALLKATAIHFSLHGSPNFLSPGIIITPSTSWSTTEISAVVAKRQIPPINVVYAAACSTCAGGSTSMANAFGITSSSIDRAYVGFNADVSECPEAQEAFWLALAGGKTVTGAIREAQIQYNRNNFAGKNGQLVKVGDGETTLNFIYTGKTDEWWKF